MSNSAKFMEPCDIKELTATRSPSFSAQRKVCVCVCLRKIKRSQRCLCCERDMLTVQLRQNTAYTCCAAELRLAGGKRTPWGARPQDLGSTGSIRTACQSNPCLLHSWKKHTKRKEHDLVNTVFPKCLKKLDFPYKSSSHTGKQRPLLCILLQLCS